MYFSMMWLTVLLFSISRHLLHLSSVMKTLKSLINCTILRSSLNTRCLGVIIFTWTRYRGEDYDGGYYEVDRCGDMGDMYVNNNMNFSNPDVTSEPNVDSVYAEHIPFFYDVAPRPVLDEMITYSECPMPYNAVYIGRSKVKRGKGPGSDYITVDILHLPPLAWVSAFEFWLGQIIVCGTLPCQWLDSRAPLLAKISTPKFFT